MISLYNMKEILKKLIMISVLDTSSISKFIIINFKFFKKNINQDLGFVFFKNSLNLLKL